MKFKNYDVVICTLNGEMFIGEQIKSILIQKIQPKNIIISDDGSTDNTIKVINDTFADFGYSSYVIVNGPMKGVKHNFFSVLKYTSSEYVFMSDQDDIWKHNKSEVFRDAADLCCGGEPILYFSDSSLIDEYGNEIYRSFFEYQKLDHRTSYDGSILYKNCVQGATTMLNRSLIEIVLKTINLVDIKNIAMHDWWIAIVACSLGRAVYIDNTTIEYRQHSGNIVGAQPKRSILYRVFDWKKTFGSLIAISKQVLSYRKLKGNMFVSNDLDYIGNKYCSRIKVVVCNLCAFYFGLRTK
nr:putative glycosyltransferase [Vibrio mimicus]